MQFSTVWPASKAEINLVLFAFEKEKGFVNALGRNGKSSGKCWNRKDSAEKKLPRPWLTLWTKEKAPE